MLKNANIFLVGFSGSGKSTIGRKLARKLRVQFYDTDQIIEQAAGKSIPRIFDEDGEETFRHLEEQAVEGIVKRRLHSKVVALGGGAFENKRTRGLLSQSGVVIYLSCAQDELLQRISRLPARPKLRVQGGMDAKKSRVVLRERMKSLLAKRQKNYKTAHLTFSTTGKDPDKSTTELKSKLVRMYARNSR
ncbi:MAG: shikimate kinase [Candidatus Zixiibacteriota bacterium]